MTPDAETTLAVQRVVSLYHHLIDGTELERLSEVFTEDAVLDLTAFDRGSHVGLPAILKYFRTPQPTTHTTTSSYVFQDEAGEIRSHSKTVSVRYDGTTIVSLHNDLMRLTPNGWRSIRLVITSPVK